MGGIMTNSEKVVGGHCWQGGRLRQVPLIVWELRVVFTANRTVVLINQLANTGVIQCWSTCTTLAQW